MIRVHALRTGSVYVRPSQITGRAPFRRLRPFLERGWSEALPILAFLIEHPEGLFLVDSGESPGAMTGGYFPPWHPYFRLAVRFAIAEEEAIDMRLKALGVAPGDLRAVVLTHLHTDHAGGLAHLPPVRTLVARIEWQLAQGVAGQVRGYCLDHLPRGFRPRIHPLRCYPARALPARHGADHGRRGDDRADPGAYLRPCFGSGDDAGAPLFDRRRCVIQRCGACRARRRWCLSQSALGKENSRHHQCIWRSVGRRGAADDLSPGA